MMVFRACVATGHELLLEVIPPPAAPGAESAAALHAVEHFYAAGVRPDWWKLPPLTEPAGWRRLGDAVRARDPDCRGILVLGQDLPDTQLAHAFDAAAGESMV